MDYYRLRGSKHIPMRQAETQADFDRRLKLIQPFVQRVVRILARSYAKAPTRTIERNPRATEWLARAYAKALIDSKLQHCDRMSHLNGMCALQVAATGDLANPLKFTHWTGWHEVVPFEAPGRANEVASVVTVDCWDQQTTFTWWTPDWYRTYRSEKLLPLQTSGGRVAEYVPELSGPNPYKRLPFAFFWFEQPSDGIDELAGLGPFLSDLNGVIDVTASDMADAVQKYLTPFGVAYNCDPSFNPVKNDGFIRVELEPNGFENPPQPRLEFLQAKLDVPGGWEHIRSVIDGELEALGVPLTAYRMDSRTLPSGDALEAEQKPLRDYVDERRPLWLWQETELAKCCLEIAGEYYGAPELLAAAQDVELTLLWPAPAQDTPSADRDAQDAAGLAMGVESRVTIAMRRYGLNRPQAIAYLKQIDEDNAAFGEPRAALPAPTDDDPEPAAERDDEDDEPDDEDDDDDD